MATPKKTNLISYELKDLERYIKQLKKHLDENPPDEAEDRFHETENSRTGAVFVKVVQTKENIIKAWRENLKAYTDIVAVLNQLRALAAGSEEKPELRGNVDTPGFMEDDEEDEETPDDQTISDARYSEWKDDLEEFDE